MFNIKKNSVNLNEKHSYFYQVQMQMAITERMFCDFVVWSEQNVFIERINFNQQFWEEKCAKASLFHKRVIIPELLAKIFSDLGTIQDTLISTDNSV